MLFCLWFPFFALLLLLSGSSVLGGIPITSEIHNVDGNKIMNEGDTNTDTTNDESTRETLKAWSDRWANKRIGFHLKEVNPVLVNHAATLFPSDDAVADDETCEASNGKPTRIFVPLCGKAIDMAYLATLTKKSVEVVGLEGIRVALEEFIEEQPDLQISKAAIPRTPQIPFERFVGERVSLWKGDYFDLDKNRASKELLTSMGTFEAIYDRASIVAIDPPLREDYVAILDQLLKPGGTILLVALERVASPENVEATKKGPPHSLPGSILKELFANVGGEDAGYSYSVEVLQVTDQLVEKPEDRERYADLEQLLETAFLIRKNVKS